MQTLKRTTSTSTAGISWRPPGTENSTNVLPRTKTFVTMHPVGSKDWKVANAVVPLVRKTVVRGRGAVQRLLVLVVDLDLRPERSRSGLRPKRLLLTGTQIVSESVLRWALTP